MTAVPHPRRLQMVMFAAAWAIAGCGGGESGGGSGSLDESLGYLPTDAPVVAAISTDLESDAYMALDSKLDTLGVPGGLEEQLRESFEEEDENGERASYEKDVKPLLGETLVVGAASPAALTTGAGVVAAIDVGDPEKLAVLLEGAASELRRAGEASGADLYLPEDEDSGAASAAIDGETLVVSDSPGALRDALERKDSEDKLDEKRFEEAVAGLPDDPLARVAVDPELLFEAVPELQATTELPWPDAVQTVGLSVTATDAGFELDAALTTDPEGLEESDLPISTANEELEVLARDGELVSASANQSLSTRFLLRAVGAAYPDSEFERRRVAVEDDLGVRLDDLLAQFDGPSVSAQAPSGIVATRSELSDPQVVAKALPKLVPRLPELAEALGPIGERTTLTVIRTLAPKLPIPGDGLDEPGVTAGRVPGEKDLYRLSAAVPSASGDSEQVVFGVIGDSFVVAADPAAGREIATAETELADGLSGGSVFSADPLFLTGVLGGVFGAGEGQLPGVEGLRGYLRASTAEITLHSELRIR